jgi:uncharacterized protein YbjT (DUF2867 family)
MSARRSVAVLGATGLVGRQIVTLLIDDATVERVVVLTRRPAGFGGLKVEERIVELAHLRDAADALAVDQIFCALGTTIRKAGSREAFRRIDHDYPLLAGRLALERGAGHYLLVSALGADARSRIPYNRVKGELEESLATLGFRSLTIARPSLLLGDRVEKRRGEDLAKKFEWLLPPKYRGIEARTVARALTAAAHADEAGVLILESREMRRRFAG